MSELTSKEYLALAKKLKPAVPPTGDSWFRRATMAVSTATAEVAASGELFVAVYRVEREKRRV